MKGVPSKVIRPNVRTVNFGCYVRKAERGCSNTKGYNRAGKRLEHPTPVHKTKSVWLYATNLPCARLNNLATEVGGFRYSRGFSPRGCPRFAVTPTTKSLLTQPLYGKGRNPPLSKPPELALGDAFSGLNDYDTGVTPGCCSGWNGLTDPVRGVFDFQYRRTTGSDKQLHRGRSSVRHHLHPVARGASKVRA